MKSTTLALFYDQCIRTFVSEVPVSKTWTRRLQKISLKNFVTVPLLLVLMSTFLLSEVQATESLQNIRRNHWRTTSEPGKEIKTQKPKKVSHKRHKRKSTKVRHRGKVKKWSQKKHKHRRTAKAKYRNKYKSKPRKTARVHHRRRPIAKRNLPPAISQPVQLPDTASIPQPRPVIVAATSTDVSSAVTASAVTTTPAASTSSAASAQVVAPPPVSVPAALSPETPGSSESSSTPVIASPVVTASDAARTPADDEPTPEPSVIEKALATAAAPSTIPVATPVQLSAADKRLPCLRGTNYTLPKAEDFQCKTAEKVTVKLEPRVYAKICPKAKAEGHMQGSLLVTANNTRYIYRYNGDAEKVPEGCKTTTGAGNVCLIPFLHVAADPLYHSMGDIIQVPELVGTVMPNPNGGGGTIPHPGYLIVADVGGAIKGRNRFDFFIGDNNWKSDQNPFGPSGLVFTDRHRCVSGFRKIESGTALAAQIQSGIYALVDDNKPFQLAAGARK